MKEIQLGQTTYFYFPVNNTAGSGNNGASALFDVRQGGAAADAAPVFSGSATLLTNAAYPLGCYEIAIPATVGNGFAVNNEYAVFATIAVDSQNPTGFVGSFSIASTVGSVTAHFTDRTTNGFSTVQSLNGTNTIHITGEFAGANLTIWGGSTGQDPTEFNPLRVFTSIRTINLKDYSGDIRCELNNAGVGTSISVFVQQVIE